MKNERAFESFSAGAVQGFSRTIAEIEWLTLLLVLLYQVTFAPEPEAASALAVGVLGFAAFVLIFRYADFYREAKNWKPALETWAMLGFITWVLAHTGGLNSPLVNLYLLVVIATALALSKAAMLLQMGLIAACYAWLAAQDVATVPAQHYLVALATKLTPVVLVAYVTTMLSADIRHALMAIKALSETDELTGVANMRAFNEIAERVARQAVRYSHPYTVMMIDSDSLKSINDAFGHEAGNQLLKKTAGAIQHLLRESDVLARYGGDEFVVLLPETTAANGESLAQRIRHRIQFDTPIVDSKSVTATVSIGIASYPDDGTDLPTLLGQADSALYSSKREGKNRVSRASAVQTGFENVVRSGAEREVAPFVKTDFQGR